MTEQNPMSSDAPFGTEPRRSAWPLLSVAALLVLCVLALLWMVIQYPAR